MNNLLSLLPYVAYLACPVGMGLAMWFMMRENKGQAADSHGAQMGARAGRPVNDLAAREGQGAFSNVDKAETAAGASVKDAAGVQGMLRIVGMCLDPRVIAGLAVVGLVTWALAPGFVWAILPLLLLAACPLSMLFMMRGMQGSHGVQGGELPSHTNDQGRPLSETGVVATTSGESLANLKGQLANIQAQQEAIARKIARLEHLEAVPPSPTPDAQTIPDPPGHTRPRSVGTPGEAIRG